ncbi:MAG TPA: Rap1a/Tai family immunity protein [Anaerolineales bacterium]|nr:Rap1a/Tai family immunity protein [Anaerolineales bacterium]
MKRLLALALGLSALPTTAHAMTGNQILEYCGSNSQAVVATCQLYIVGVTDGLTLAGVRDGNPILKLDGVTGIQQRDLLVSYLRQHPEVRHLSAPIIIWELFRDTFGTEIIGSK